MKRFIIFLVFFALSVAACGGSSLEDDIVGKWVVTDAEEPFKNYEFFSDGTGLQSNDNGSITNEFTYEFTDDSTMTFVLDTGGALVTMSMTVSMPDEDSLTFDPGFGIIINLRRLES